MDREVIHVIPQEFIVDDQDGIKDPVGMIGVRLEAEVHIITGAVTSAQNIVKCVNRAGLQGERHRARAAGLLAGGAHATTRRSWACCLIDIGGGTTDVAGLHRGRASTTPRCCPLGGDHVTNDIVDHAAHARSRRPSASRSEYGCAPGRRWSTTSETSSRCPGVGGGAARDAARARSLAEIIQPRMEEIFAHGARARSRRQGYCSHARRRASCSPAAARCCAGAAGARRARSSACRSRRRHARARIGGPGRTESTSPHVRDRRRPGALRRASRAARAASRPAATSREAKRRSRARGPHRGLVQGSSSRELDAAARPADGIAADGPSTARGHGTGRGA
ncbi:MAG: hypothetical protein MZV64_25835 [Ignavibacteriales bacterium]|nr:hypothetical protein [Ignavibacteriales bacterium]